MSAPETDIDLDLLEAFLDGELSVAQSALLDRRLAHDPALAAALDSLRAQHAARRAVFASFQPTDAHAAAFARRAIAAAKNQERWEAFNRFTRRYSAAAALILVGFLTGWLGHGAGASSPLVDRDPSAGPLALNSASFLGGDFPTNSPASDSNASSSFASFPGFSSPSPSPAANTTPGVYRVEIFDALGRQTGVQTFNSLDEAKEFARELNHLRQPQETVPLQPPLQSTVQPRSSQIVPASYEEY